MTTQENKELVALLKKHAVTLKKEGGTEASIGFEMEELAAKLVELGKKPKPITFAKAVPITKDPYQPIGGG
jgi:hypothetical protein